MLRHFVFILSCLTAVSVTAADRTLLVLGDSLSAAYGIDMDQGWVSLLHERLQEQGYNYRVINTSISGDTTRGAVARLEQTLKRSRPDIAIIELGGNDGLRGLSLQEMQRNLIDIVNKFRRAGSRVLLIPMQLPPNYGPAYNNRFMDIYRDLAEHDDVVLGRFILEDIADKPHLMQDDGIHPRAEAQDRMLDNIWPQLESMLSMKEGNPE
ncbi:MAG: arylesterase [Gammaproteobacteria bacterium]